MRRGILIAVLALVAAACSGGDDPVVATVGEVDIVRSDVVALRTTPDDLVVLDSGDFRNELMFLVAQEAVAAGLSSDFGIVVTDEDVVAARQANLASGDLTIDEAVAAMEDPAATPARFDGFVRSQLLREQAMDAIGASDELLDDIFATRMDLVVTVCPRHVLVPSEAEAIAVLDRLTGGEDLAAVADDVSTDTGSPGGQLGCGPAARFVEPFALATLDAPLGEPFGPVESEFGWHVVVVDERTTPTRDEVASDPRGHLPETLMQTEFTQWFNDKLEEVDIVVLEDVGTWAPEGPGILPPGEGDE